MSYDKYKDYVKPKDERYNLEDLLHFVEEATIHTNLFYTKKTDMSGIRSRNILRELIRAAREIRDDIQDKRKIYKPDKGTKKD